MISEITEADLRQQKLNVVMSPSSQSDSLAWPDGDAIDSAVFARYGKLHSVVNQAFQEKDATAPLNTRAVVIVHEGKLVAEQYAPTFSQHTKLMGWSMTKTITNAIVGVLVRQGKLNVMTPAPVQEWKQDERRAITLNDLMHASSGLEWEEVYSGPSMATVMLFRKADAAGYAARSKLVHRFINLIRIGTTVAALQTLYRKL